MLFSFRSIAFEGRIAVIGFASGKIPQIPANLLLVKSCSAVGVYWGSNAQKNPKIFKASFKAALFSACTAEQPIKVLSLSWTGPPPPHPCAWERSSY